MPGASGGAGSPASTALPAPAPNPNQSGRTWPGSDRRLSTRIPVSLPAELTLAGRRLLGALRDLSPQGAYIELLDREPGQVDGDGHLEAAVLGGACPVSVRSLRRVDGLVTGVGLELTGLSEEARGALAARIAALEVRKRGP